MAKTKALKSKTKNESTADIENKAPNSKSIKKKKPTSKKQPATNTKRKPSPQKTNKNNDDNDDSSDDEDSGWEEVKVDNPDVAELVASMNKNPIEIKIDLKTGKRAASGTRKKSFDMVAYLKRTQEALRKQLAIEIHKSHLICWLYHGQYLSKLCNNRYLHALALSQLPTLDFLNNNDAIRMTNIQSLLALFKKIISYETTEAYKSDDNMLTYNRINQMIVDMKCANNVEYVLLVLILLRCLGVKARLAICFDVYDIKKTSSTKKSSDTRSQVDDDNNEDENDPITPESEEYEIQVKQIAPKKRKSTDEQKPTTRKKIKDNNAQAVERPSRKCKEKNVAALKDDFKQEESKYFKNQDDYDDEEEEEPINNKKPKNSQKQDTESESESEYFNNANEDDDAEFIRKPRTSRSSSKKTIKQTTVNPNDSSVHFPTDADEYIESIKSTQAIQKLKNKKQPAATKPTTSKVISANNSIAESDDNDDYKPKFNDFNNYWIEIFLDDEQQWVCVEPVKCKINCAEYLEKKLGAMNTQYVCAFDNDDRVKDVTIRYSSEWNGDVRKLRIESFDTTFWWEKALFKYRPIDLENDTRENRILNDLLYLKPMPKSINEFKGHPLYVLKRHLLKFQSIYPPDAKPVDTLRGEEIYSKQYLVTLRSKQTWLKFARTVRSNEHAYKIVKGRVKQSDYKMGVRANPDLELYGFWQTQPYEPPVAANGKVPRNEYGNVELFQKCMLPVGCVHLSNMPNLNKICKKLDIDCAAAVVGFDAHHGFSHAVLDGWIVCEEFKDIVVDAYREEERKNELERVQKEKERILGYWKRLTRGLLIRERLKAKYDGGLPENDEQSQSNDRFEATVVENEPMIETKSVKFVEPQEKNEKIVKSKPKQSRSRAKPAASISKPALVIATDGPKYETRRSTRSTQVNYKVDEVEDSDDGEFIPKNRRSSSKKNQHDDANSYEPSEQNVVENEDDPDADDVPDDEYDENSNKKAPKTSGKSTRKKTANKKQKTTESTYENFSSKFRMVRRELEPQTQINDQKTTQRADVTFNLSEDEL